MSIKNAVIISSIVCVFILSTSVIGSIMLKKKVSKSTIVYKGKKADEIINQNVNDEKKNDENILVNENNSRDNINEKENKNGEEIIGALSNVDKKESMNKDSSSMDIAILGEMMMGGQVTKNLNYVYSTAFKDVYMEANLADFTYTNFSTNITNLDKIENAKSKYLVNREVISAFRALGIDCASIASDHIVDFPGDILKNTIDTLEKNDVFVAGRQDTPVYFEKGDKKIAIVSTNSVIIGTNKNYTKQDISIYTKENLEKNIKEAKSNADVVIADIHWGREYEYGVTDKMREISMHAIDSGADMVMGSHAAGVYPIVQYNGKPIIYSTGYLISDSDLYVAKESFIFNINVSKEKKINKITMTPTYINDKREVLKYFTYDEQKANEYLEQFNRWHLDNSLNSSIENGKIVIRF